MKTIDLTTGKRPNLENGEMFYLTVEFRTGTRYSYSGKTKKEAELNFKKAFGNYRGFVKKEWTIE